MTDGSDASAPPQWHQNSRITSALITGVFGLIGTAVTIFVMRLPVPQTGPAVTTLGSTAAGAVLQTTAGAPAVPQASVATSRREPNLLLNFAVFQDRLATPDVGREERDRIVRPLLGRFVVWKGYVDEVTPMASPTGESAVTVSLVESLVKTNQSMFKTPALFRFGPESLDAVANLAPGDLVTISGKMTDHSLIATNVTGARLMTVNGLPAARTASVPETESVR